MFLIIGKISCLILVTNTAFNYNIKFFRIKYFNLLCLLSSLFQQFYPQKKVHHLEFDLPWQLNISKDHTTSHEKPKNNQITCIYFNYNKN